MTRGSQRDYHTLVERHVQRLLLHHHYNLLGGFLRQHVAIGLGMRGNDVLVRLDAALLPASRRLPEL
jgi:hypothetical protein